MRYAFIGTLAALTLALGACDNEDHAVAAGAAGTTTVNGSLRVPAGEHTGPVGTVNGAVDIDENAVVGRVHTVNGSIDMAAHATAESVKAVNGPVSLASGAHVTHNITTVNGSIELASGAEVGGAIKNVNGQMILTGAHVAGGLHTVSGDIDVGADSHVEGGILVEDSGWFSDWFGHDTRKPRIVIGPGAVVSGALRFERDVNLYVSDKATIGEVTGATPVRFSGEKPPA